MALTATQIAARDGKLTASRIKALMTGDDAEILDLWKELTGDPSWEPKDLSDVWPVQLGSVTEELNLDWYARKTGRAVTRRGEVVVHPTADWAACTLDGFDEGEGAVIEAKHVGGWEPREKVVARYVPQVVWQMIVTGARKGVLTIIEGGKEPALEPIAWDQAYADELWRRAVAFMECVWDLTPPVALAPVEAPKPVETWRQFDLDAMQEAGEAWPNWAAAIEPNLSSWKGSSAAAKTNEAASKKIKELLPDDVNKLTHAGVLVTRSRTGAVSIKAKDA